MGRRDRLLLSVLSGSYAASLAGSWRRFTRAAADPEAAQGARLRAILAELAGSARGGALRLGEVTSVEAFQRRAPIASYEEHRPWIERAAAGEARALTSAPILAFERSTGTTGGDKLIPYTRGFLAELAAATGPWLFSMYAARPRLLGTTSYWSLSPVARDREVTPGGVPVGFEDDTEYFGPLARRALGKMMSVPKEVARIREVPAWRQATARHLLADEELGFISVWSPTFLTLLMEHLERELKPLLSEIPAGRATAILRRLERAGAVTGPALWPRLALISCWTDGQAAGFLPQMQRYFPGVELQGKGLLATEGVVSFPLSPLSFDPATAAATRGAVLAVGSHFLELVDLEAPAARPRLAHQLRIGGRYSPLLTTSGGLVRYPLGDEIECVGLYRRAPLVRFVGKLDRVSDLAGEKLTTADADRALAAASASLGARFDFALLAPCRGGAPHYRLYLEGPSDPGLLDRTAALVDEALQRGHHYRYCRDLGQLGPVVAVPIEGGWRRYEAELVRRGTRAGDIKPTHLEHRPFWIEVFEPGFERSGGER